ncbi:1-propanol dehydrogenase PduQ [Diplocloster agilis]|uniref:Iron-containing alcohol dehydrogenase n=1 Tax=Diplocloster agilis TaxID=2850323 RepID=A0A949NHR7_9FIRM|nr:MULTISPECIES: 1-propanol dehydrogenase PduQ [Lachnospiraceae]MBU9736545.1 iron-containing alcohol dehydrogenase [Diplocloster agilis]MBU9744402.1 iron-containing alcohol dehydrogenase [Diplocloster agilis]MCU6735032.1 iron-containing alcohol dehydrogenase [Suonthocola fibrivorans]SCJ62029.1 Aldehyde-alcohol dehydrogenase [uncultured Clostridium sp.]
MKSFDIKTKIYFGENSLDRLVDIPYKKVMIITDPFVVQSGMIKLITYRLDSGDIEFDVFKDVVPDPPIEKIVTGVQAVVGYKPQALIAVGGGSAIDSAKAIKDFALKTGELDELALIAVPTTSGTGSEVTSFSVITDTQSHVKYPLVSETLIPTEAILDAELVRSVPPAVTADTGMDVFTHALEAYVSINNNEFSAALAEKAIEICGVFLLRAFLDGNDTHARQKMHVASCLAGLAFNSASLGLNHGMAHQLGANFHVPHGRANAMLLPHIIEFNSDINIHSRSRKEYLPQVKKYVNIAKILGLQNFNTITTVRALVNWVQFMLKEMDIPLSMSQYGKCTEEEYMSKISTMAEAALADSCTATNPRVANKADVMDIYRNLW